MFVDFFVSKYNYWITIVLMMIGLYGVIAKQNLVKKVIGLSIFQTSIILIIMGFVYERIDMFIDLAIAYALLNFMASVAAAKLIRRKEQADPWEEWEEVEAGLLGEDV